MYIMLLAFYNWSNINVVSAILCLEMYTIIYHILYHTSKAFENFF